MLSASALPERPDLEADATCLLAKVEAYRGELAAARRHLADYRLELATARALARDTVAARRLVEQMPPTPPSWPGHGLIAPWSAWVLEPDDPATTTRLETAAMGLHRPAERVMAARTKWLLGQHHVGRAHRGEAIRLCEWSARRYASIGALGPLARVEELLRALSSPALADQARVVTSLREGIDPGLDQAPLTEAERRVAIAVRGGLFNKEDRGGALRLGANRRVPSRLGLPQTRPAQPHRAGPAHLVRADAPTLPIRSRHGVTTIRRQLTSALSRPSGRNQARRSCGICAKVDCPTQSGNDLRASGRPLRTTPPTRSA